MTTDFELFVLKRYYYLNNNFEIEVDGTYSSRLQCFIIDKNNILYRDWISGATSSPLSIDERCRADAVARKRLEDEQSLVKEFNFISRFYKMMPFNYGVEIEFYGSYFNRLDEEIKESLKDWILETDSSCGYELVSPILSEHDSSFEQIKQAVSLIKTCGGKISNRCGLHVHIGAEALSTERIYNIVKRYHENEHHIDSFMAMSRREDNNLYCKSIYDSFGYQFLSREFHPDKFIYVSDLVKHQGSRYCKVNLHSYRTHGTIEFRQHGGTLSSKRIIMWVRFLQEFVKYTNSDNVQDLGWDKLFHSDDVRKYYTVKRDGLASREDKLCSHGYTYEGSWQ
jgi:hypothetical protein